MVTGVSEKERGRGREKKIIITFHSVTKKRIELFKTKYLLANQFFKERIHKLQRFSILVATWNLTSLPKLRTVFLILSKVMCL